MLKNIANKASRLLRHRIGADEIFEMIKSDDDTKSVVEKTFDFQRSNQDFPDLYDLLRFKRMGGFLYLLADYSNNKFIVKVSNYPWTKEELHKEDKGLRKVIDKFDKEKV